MTFAPDVTLVDRVNSSSQAWRQGDVPQLPTASQAWFATPAMPLTLPSNEMTGDRFGVVLAAAERLVIVTQTCDIVRDCRDYAHVTLAGVVRLGPDKALQAQRGHRPRFVALPGLGPEYFADTSLLVSAEKTILLEVDRLPGVVTDHNRRQFADGIARSFGRSALPDDLVRAFDKLTRRIKQKHDKDSDEGRALRLLGSIRVRGLPSWTADDIDVRVLFCPNTQSEAESCMSPKQWDDMVDEWVGLTEPDGVIRDISGDWLALDRMTALDYLESDHLDLEYLSSRRPISPRSGPRRRR